MGDESVAVCGSYWSGDEYRGETAKTSRTKIGVMCESRKLRVNMGKSKVLVCSREGGQAELRVRLNGELLGEVESFKYQGSIISKDAGVSMDVRQRERGSGGLWGDEEYLESKGGWNEGKERIV